MSQQYEIGKHKTRVWSNDNFTFVQYHDTRVVTFNDNIIILNTGGYFSSTTKTRMNQTSNQFDLGYKVYQKNFEWFVDFKDETFEFTNNNDLILDR